MALAAELEHEPTRAQILKHVNYQTLDSLSAKLHEHSIDLSSVLHKVLIDASSVRQRREAWKNNKKEYRKLKENVSTDVSLDVLDREKDKEIDKEKDIKEEYAKHDVSPCPHQDIISLYHETLPELPPVKIWTPQRQAILRARWTEDPERQCLEWWREYFKKIRGSPFLMGHEKDFRVDLEWIIRPKNMPKIIEGRYAKRNGNGKRHAGIKAWLERDNEETGQDAICEGDGSSGGDLRPGTGTV